MTTSYIECDHRWIGGFNNLFKAYDWSCQLCEVRTWRAPWSYRELLLSIGLETFWDEHRSNALLTGQPMLSRKTFLGGLAVFVMTPDQMIRALQSGVSVGFPALAGKTVIQQSKPRLVS